MKAAWFAAVLVSCSFLAGCGSFGSVDQVLARNPAPRPRGDATPAPNLRIPGDNVNVASAQEIPLVPVPPVPLGRGAAPQAPAAPAAAPKEQPTPAPFPEPSVAVTPASADTAPPAPAKSAETEQNMPSLRQLHQQAVAWYAGVDSYTVRMTRREQVNGTAKPEEVMLFRFRKEPWSVYFKWIGDAGKGREVIYVKGMYENKIHTRLAAGDAPLMPAGTHMALAPDSILVRSASRHSITEAGIGAAIDRFGALLDAQERGDKRRGVLNDLGLQKRPEFGNEPVRAAELTLPPGVEAELPKGGRRDFYFDNENHLPMLVLSYDDKNQEVEYYSYSRLMAPGHLDAADFDPERLWAKPKAADSKAQ